MKKYNVSVPKKYTKDGEEKSHWNNVGSLIYFEATNDKPAGFILELSMFPETKFGVFPVKDKPANVTVDALSGQSKVEYPTEEINPEDIPF